MGNLFKGTALFIGGAIVGAAAALLLAPKKGEELRQDLADLAEEAKDRAQNFCEQVRQEMTQAQTQPQAEAQTQETEVQDGE